MCAASHLRLLIGQLGHNKARYADIVSAGWQCMQILCRVRQQGGIAHKRGHVVMLGMQSSNATACGGVTLTSPRLDKKLNIWHVGSVYGHPPYAQTLSGGIRETHIIQHSNESIKTLPDSQSDCTSFCPACPCLEWGKGGLMCLTKTLPDGRH